jgi:hypothetical protein
MLPANRGVQPEVTDLSAKDNLQVALFSATTQVLPFLRLIL